MKRKRYAVGILSIIMSITFLFGCNGTDDDTPTPGDEEEEKEQQRDLFKGTQ